MTAKELLEEYNKWKDHLNVSEQVAETFLESEDFNSQPDWIIVSKFAKFVFDTFFG